MLVMGPSFPSPITTILLDDDDDDDDDCDTDVNSSRKPSSTTPSHLSRSMVGRPESALTEPP